MYFWISTFDHRAIVLPKMHIVQCFDFIFLIRSTHNFASPTHTQTQMQAQTHPHINTFLLALCCGCCSKWSDINKAVARLELVYCKHSTCSATTLLITMMRWCIIMCLLQICIGISWSCLFIAWKDTTSPTLFSRVCYYQTKPSKACFYTLNMYHPWYIEAG